MDFRGARGRARSLPCFKAFILTLSSRDEDGSFLGLAVTIRLFLPSHRLSQTWMWLVGKTMWTPFQGPQLSCPTSIATTGSSTFADKPLLVAPKSTGSPLLPCLSLLPPLSRVMHSEKVLVDVILDAVSRANRNSSGLGPNRKSDAQKSN